MDEQTTRLYAIAQESKKQLNEVFFEQGCVLTTYEKEILLQLAETCMTMRDVSVSVDKLRSEK